MKQLQRASCWSVFFLAIGLLHEVALAATVGKIDPTSTGTVAVRAAQGEWRFLEVGEDVLSEHELRTACDGVVRIEIPNGRLALGANSRVVFGQAAQEFQIHDGCAAIELNEAAQTWTVTYAGSVTSIPAGAECDFDIVRTTDADSLIGNVWRGTVTTRKNVPEAKSQAITGQGFRWDSETPAIVEQPLPKHGRAEKMALKPTTRRQSLGKLHVKDPTTGLPVRLHVAQYHVNVVIDPPMALVQIDQSFYSPFNQQAEGTYFFDLPEKASVSRFAMFTAPDRLIEGELIGRPQARQIYDSIVHARRDPAILEQVERRRFRMQVFPIFPKDTKRVLLDFTMPLEEQPNGEYVFRLPMLSDDEPIWDFQISGTVRGPVTTKSLNSPTHGRSPGWSVESNNQEATFLVSEKNYRSSKDFVARFQMAPATEPSLRVEPVNEDGQSGHYFLATIPAAQVMKPAELEQARRPLQTGVDLLILADSSLSMSPHRETQRRVIEHVLNNLRPNDRFKIAAIDSEFRSRDDEWQSANHVTKAAALHWLDHEYFLGNSDFEKTLPQARHLLTSTAANTQRRIMLYVGDGARNNRHFDLKTLELPNGLPRAIEQAAVLIGDRTNSIGIIEQWLAERGGPLFEHDNDGQRELLRWLLGGFPMPMCLYETRETGMAPENLMSPLFWMPGTPLRFLGRSTATDVIQVSTRVISEVRSTSTLAGMSLSLDKARRDHFVGRAWVQQHLQRLYWETAFDKNNAGKQKLEEELIALSREWTVLCPLTAFLVLETEADYGARKIVRAKRRPYWQPVGSVVAQPHFNHERAKADLLKIATTEAEARIAAHSAKQVAKLRKALAENSPAMIESLMAELRQLRTRTPEVDEVMRDAAVWLQLSFERRNAELALGKQRESFERSKTKAARPKLASASQRGVVSYDSIREQLYPAWTEKLLTPPKRELPLSDFIQWLAKETSTQILLDTPALEVAGAATDAPVLIATQQPLAADAILKLALRPLQLQWAPHEGIACITTMDAANQQLRAIRYPIADLIDPTVPLTADRLMLPALDRVEEFRSHVRQQLRAPSMCNFVDTPLEDALSLLSTQHELPFVVDRASLEASGAASDVPLTLKLEKVPLSSVLGLMLRDQQLTMVPDGGVLLVTTQVEASQRLEVRFHSTHGLLAATSASRPRSVDRFWPTSVGGGFGGGGGGGGLGGGGLGGGLGGGGMGGASPAVSGIGGGHAVTPLPNPPPAAGAANNQTAPLNQPETAGTSTDQPAATTQSTTPSREPQDSDEPAEEGESVGVGFVAMGYDAESLVSLFTEHTSGGWALDGSGTGTIGFLPAQRGFVVRQTTQVQDEIEALLTELRRHSRSSETQSNSLPFLETLDTEANAQALINIVTDATNDGWEMYATGVGTISFDPQTRTLNVRQTFNGHREILELLTRLRRARYRALFGEDWQPTQPTEAAVPLLELMRHDFKPIESPEQIEASQEQQPQRVADSITTLPVRRESAAGQLTRWRHLRSGEPSTPASVISHLTLPAAFEWQHGRRFVRVEGERAAVFDPLTQLVMIGPWGQDVRQRLGQQLPWLPHLSNQEIAKHFIVTKQHESPQSVRLRLQARHQPPRGIQLPELSECASYIEVEYSKDHGLPLSWNAYLLGALSYRLKFEDLVTEGAPQWRRIRCEDATGQELERWELLDRRACASFARAACDAVHHGKPISEVTAPQFVPTIPTPNPGARGLALRAGWSDAIVVDFYRMVEGAPHTAEELFRAIQLFDSQDFQQARETLRPMQQRWPEHPFLNALEAACWARQEDGVERRDNVAACLRRLAARNSIELLNHLFALNSDAIEPETNGAQAKKSSDHTGRRVQTQALGQSLSVRSAAHFFGLNPVDVYDIYQSQPKTRRQPADQMRLVDLACSAGRYELALKESLHIENPAAFPELLVLQVRSLIALNRREEALKLVDNQVSALKNEPELLMSLAAELRQGKQFDRADALAQQALDLVPQSVERRAALLWQQAQWQRDLPRWQSMAAAIECAASDVSLQQLIWNRLSGELREAGEQADLLKLSETAKTQALKLQLDRIAALNEAENNNHAAVANLLWPHWERGTLPRGDELWLFQSCVKSRQTVRARAIFEAEMSRPNAAPRRFLEFTAQVSELDVGFGGINLRERIESSKDDIPAHRNTLQNSHWFPQPQVIPGGGGGFF